MNTDHAENVTATWKPLKLFSDFFFLTQIRKQTNSLLTRTKAVGLIAKKCIINSDNFGFKEASEQ